MDKKIFKDGLEKLSLCFPNNEFKAKILWEFWQDLSDDNFIKAVKEVCFNHTEIYPGTNIVALIRGKANKISNISADEAWGEVLGQIQGCWEHESPKFNSPLVKKAVDYIGWSLLFDSNTEDLPFRRKEFVNIYNNLLERESREELPQIEQPVSGAMKQLTDKIGG